MNQELGAGVYRSGELKQQCAICREWAVAACPCCNRPLCSAHAPRRGQWCASCEAEYQEESRNADLRGEQVIAKVESAIERSGGFVSYPGVVAGVLAITLALGAGLGLLLGLNAINALIVGAVCMPVGVISAGVLLHRLSFSKASRQRFLQTRTARLLEAARLETNRNS